MKIIDIKTSSPYKVVADCELLKSTGELIKEYAALKKDVETAVLITDDTVGGMYADIVAESLRAAGYKTITYTLPHGESSKNITEYAALLEFLAGERITRSDFIVALGGGVIGDLAGTGKRDGGAVVVDVDAGAVCSHVALDGRVAIHGDGGAVFQIEAAAVAAGPVARNLRAAAQGKLGAVVVIVNAAAVAIVGMVARHSRAIFERNRAV